MLCKDPESRPTAEELVVRLADQDGRRLKNAPSMFGQWCCQVSSALPPSSLVQLAQGAGFSQDIFDDSLGDTVSRQAPSIFDSAGRPKNAYSSTLGTSHHFSKSDVELLYDLRDDSDAGTTYSTDSSTNGAELGYIQIFTHRLIHEMEIDANVEGILNMSVSGLDDILKGFAGRLHEESTNSFGWEASVALNRKREYVCSSSGGPSLLSISQVSRLYANAYSCSNITHILKGWGALSKGGADTESSSATNAIEDLPERRPFVKTRDDVSLWMTGIEQMPHDLVEGRAAHIEPAVEELVPRLKSYESFVPKSDAYRWLLSRLNAEQHLSYPTPSVKSHITSKVLETLRSQETHRKISRRKPTPVVRMFFYINWALIEYIDHLGLTPSTNLWDEIMCLTGSSDKAQLITVADYLRQTWPTTGEHIGKFLIELILAPADRVYDCKSVCQYATDHANEDTDDTTQWHGLDLKASEMSANQCLIVATGGAFFLSELAEQIAWLSATLRLSPNKDVMMAVNPRIQSLAIGDRTESGSKLLLASCFIALEFRESAPNLTSTNGLCWTRLFANPILVSGYPIPRRRLSNTGLEASLQSMASLLRTSQVIRFDDRIFMEGFSSLLVATGFRDGLVLWHAITSSKTDERISYFDHRIENLVKEMKDTPLLRSLENAWHIIGWCSKATDFCGKFDAQKESSLGRR